MVSQIPKHFNALGQVDAYGDLGIIWLLSAIGLVLYVGLNILARFPFVFNYLIKVTDENAKRLYTLGVRTIRLLKVIVILSFAFLNLKTIEIALNRTTEIGKCYLPIFLSVMVILVGTMIYKQNEQ